MAINVTKPSVNLREKLNELDYDKVPFQKMPAGSVLQVKEITAEHEVNINNTAGGQSGLYGLLGGRLYSDLVSIAFTPVSTTSKFVIFSSVGMASAVLSDKGAWGVTLVKDNTTGYEKSSYPYYPANQMPNYSPDLLGHWVVDNTSTSTVTFYLKGFAYNEPSPSGAQGFRSNNYQLTIMEIAQ